LETLTKPEHDLQRSLTLQPNFIIKLVLNNFKASVFL
jgi:hypothetical protein